jgi:hypothetical protein
VGVFHRGRDVGETEQFLDGREVHTAHQKGRRESVAEIGESTRPNTRASHCSLANLTPKEYAQITLDVTQEETLVEAADIISNEAEY